MKEQLYLFIQTSGDSLRSYSFQSINVGIMLCSSGKCQIIHWRQGHKYECHPPITSSHVYDAGNDSGQKAVLRKQCEFSDDNLEIEGFSTATGTNETLVDVSDCELPILSASDGLEGRQPKADKLKNTPDVKDMELIKLLPSEFPSSVNSVNSSFSCKLKQEKSSVTAGEDHCYSAGYADSRVVHQFKASKISVSNPLGFGTEVAGIYNCKVIFPYDLFVKLYNSEKLELCPFGLTNCGNSCYANAVLQCLAFTLPLTSYLLRGLHSKACSKKEWCFTCEFEGLILKAKEGKSPLSPIGILSQIQSIGSHLGCGREEDAHEFLRYAIDAMQSVCLKEAAVNTVDQMAEETTLVGLIFGGYLRSKINCMKCQGKSERHERMMDLTVEIQGDIGILEEALAEFTATETLDGENKYHCGRCKSYEKAKKKLTVSEAPNVLTIVLKRFQSGKFGKLNKFVKFPEILNLAPYMSGTSDKSPIYQLYAVVVHLDIMNAAFSGHYVCYVRNVRGKWFKIDDSTVKPVELENVLSKEAYMLLYARFSPRAPSLSRKSMISTDRKMKSSRCSEAVNNSARSTTSKSRTSMVPNIGPAMVQRVTEGYTPWMTTDGAASFESFDSDEDKFHLMHRMHEVDSLSDNSSLFSCSDAGSCSTESTRDSTGTEDFSDYIFGEQGRSWNSPRVSSDSDSSSSSPLCSLPPPVNLKRYELDSPETSGYQIHTMGPVPEADKVWMRQSQGSRRKEHLQGKGNPPLSHSDTTKPCRKSTNRCSSSSSSSSRCSCRETDSKKFSWINHFDVRSGVSLRRSVRERTAQTLY
ncbi:ubiquitin carboxyl-terminal hydrolase 16-like [Macadamia integrifolia]|uniref:ubiquitin carboxyl-terminal hydrolase 16-like n=1 Tax=Macadamia integrifolia TaxID=60698 RepID=UPI001C4F8512|nr:ubiquitin carboxyl-terminal hydrolase 16-like [Macadamia integrifolia]